MKKIKIMALAAILSSSILTLKGADPIILPIPRKTTTLNSKVKLEASALIDCVKNKQSEIGIAEINKKVKLEKSDKLDNGKFNIILAVKNEGPAAEFIKDNSIRQIPDKTQGYIIEFGKNGKWKNSVLIMGFDKEGLLYGCITFAKLINDKQELSKVNIYDYPSCQYRFLGTFAPLYYRNRSTFEKDKKAFSELCKKEIDRWLSLKVNGIHLGSRMLKGAGQQKIMGFSEKEKAEMEWLKEITAYAKERGFHFAFYGASSVACESEVKDNPRYKGMMNLRGYLFTWSDDELIRKRAENMGEFAKWMNIDFLFIHYPDTVNENWVNRSEMDRKRFGDNRAKADANVTKIFYDTFKKIDPKINFCPTLHPYSPVYLRNDYYRKFCREFSALAPEDIFPCLREFDQKPYREMAAIYKRPIMLYYEQNRMIRQGKTRIGLDRSMLTTSPRMFKSFDNGRQDNVIYEIWALNAVDFDVLNQYAWNIDSPGAEENYTWMQRNTPYDGQGNEEFFSKTLYPICINVFGEKAASEMLKLFELQLSTAFLLQPKAISKYVKGQYNQWYKGKLPPTDFDKLIKDQTEKLKTADTIVTELAKHLEYFPKESQQKAFAKYYKEVKLLNFLAPINLCKWEAERLANDGKIEESKKEIEKGLELVKKAKEELPEAINALDNFKQKNKRGITQVPCGPGNTRSWQPKYLDKYFKDELINLEKNIALSGEKKLGEPVSEQDRAKLEQAKLIARKVPDDSIKMDGKFNESAWKNAQRLPFVKITSPKNKGLYYPKAKGEAMAAWDEKNLYIALIFNEDDIDSMVGTTGARDKFFFSDDILEVFIKPEMSKKYGHLLSNISGRKWDSVPKKTDFGMENNLRWNPEWETKFYIDYDNLKWQAEIKIPFSSFSEEFFEKAKIPPVKGDVWKINIGRERRTIEFSSIAPCSSFHDTEKYFDLAFE